MSFWPILYQRHFGHRQNGQQATYNPSFTLISLFQTFLFPRSTRPTDYDYKKNGQYACLEIDTNFLTRMSAQLLVPGLSSPKLTVSESKIGTWQKATLERLKANESVLIKVKSKFAVPSTQLFAQLFALMPNVHSVHLSVEKSGINLDGLLGELEGTFAKMETVGLYRYRGTSTRPIHKYFGSATTLHTEDTDPAYVAGFEKQIKRFVIRIDSNQIAHITGIYEGYERCIIAFAADLVELRIKTNVNDRFKYNIGALIDKLPATRPPLIDMELDGARLLDDDLHFIITRDEHDVERRTVKAATPYGLEKALSGVLLDVKFDGVDVFIPESKHIAGLQRAINSLDAKTFRQFDITTSWRNEASVVVLREMFRVLKDYRQFSVKEQPNEHKVDGDSVEKLAYGDAGTKLVANLPSGRYADAVLINAQCVEFSLGTATENTASLYGSQLVQLPVLELTLNDADFRLLAMTMLEIQATKDIMAAFNPWSRLARLTANVSADHAKILRPIIEGAFSSLRLVKFTVSSAATVDEVKGWFDGFKNWTATVETMTVTAVYAEVAKEEEP